MSVVVSLLLGVSKMPINQLMTTVHVFLLLHLLKYFASALLMQHILLLITSNDFATLVFQGGTAETLLDISFWPDVSLLDLVFR